MKSNLTVALMPPSLFDFRFKRDNDARSAAPSSMPPVSA